MVPTAALLGAGGDPALSGNAGNRSIHAVQFYEEDEALIDRLAEFFGAALGSGQACVAIATPVHRLTLLWRLQRRGLNVEQIVNEGRFCLLDAADTLASFCVDGQPVRSMFFEVMGALLAKMSEKGQGRERLALFGEMVTLLWEERRVEAAIRLEKMWNALRKEHLFSLLCAYPMKSFGRVEDQGPFRRICEEHTHPLPCESFGRLPDEPMKLRMVCELQQKAAMLQAVLDRQKSLEQELREAEEMAEAMIEDNLGTVPAADLRRMLEPMRHSLSMARMAEGISLEAHSYLDSLEQEMAKLSHLAKLSPIASNPKWRN